MKPVLPLFLLLLLPASVLSCGDSASSGRPAASAQTPAPATPQGASPQAGGAGCHNDPCRSMRDRTTPPPKVTDPAHSYTATVRTSRGDFTVQLDPAAAPVTVNNFVYLAQNHFYDGLTFHRVVPGFVVQGGDPDGNGTGGPGYKLPDETNPAPWVRGSLGMASSAAGVNGSQFFVLLGDSLGLRSSGVYNHFGKLASGEEVLSAIQVGDTIRTIEAAVQ
jgi:cyclophilin family peptidyl-prolyl cis-trans isomerase